MKKRIAIIYGGNSSEREVSLKTGKEIINNIDKSKYKIIDIEFFETKHLIKKLIRNKIDLAIIALHDGIGENGSIQGLLECLNIPYSGTKVLGSAIGMDKFISKQLLIANGLMTPKYVFLNCNEEFCEETLKNFSFPLIVKPNNEGSSVGVSIAKQWKN